MSAPARVTSLRFMITLRRIVHLSNHCGWKGDHDTPITGRTTKVLMQIVIVIGYHLSSRCMYPLVHSRSPRTTRAVIPSKETVVTVSARGFNQNYHIHIYSRIIDQSPPCWRVCDTVRGGPLLTTTSPALVMFAKLKAEPTFKWWMIICESTVDCCALNTVQCLSSSIALNFRES